MNDDVSNIDEYPIKTLPHAPLWSENFAMQFADLQSGVAAFYSLGRWHGDRTLWRELLAVSLPGDRVIFTKAYGRNVPANGVGGNLTKLEVLEPGRRLGLTFDGPVWESTGAALLEHGLREGPTRRCAIDFIFEGITPVWNMSGESAEAKQVAGSDHYEQIGRSSGSVILGDKTFVIKNGYCVRDHSRGVRDSTQYHSHIWINGTFPDGRSLLAYAMKSPGTMSIGMANATIIEGNKLHAAKVVDGDFLGGLDQVGKPYRVVLESSHGRTTLLVKPTSALIPVSFVQPFDTAMGIIRHVPSALCLDGSVRLEWNGAEGVGWTERGMVLEPW